MGILFPSVILSRLDEFLEWMLSSGRSCWAQDRENGWDAVAFVREEVTGDDLMVPSGLSPDDSLLCCLVKQKALPRGSAPIPFQIMKEECLPLISQLAAKFAATSSLCFPLDT